MKKVFAAALLPILLVIAPTVNAQETKAIEGKRVYNIGVSEGQSPKSLNRLLDEHSGSISEGNRGLVSEIFSAYRTFCTGKASNLVNEVVNVGISYLAYSLKSHRGEWQKEVMQECSFKKNLNMNQDISDFYMTTSKLGALDLHDIAFRGFSCRQYISTAEGPVDVMYASFSLDTTETGIKRMLQHSKFQMRVDTLIFNPYICEIPNDSVIDPSHRIGFDFKRRKDFVIRLDTSVKSSWVNEAIQVAQDVKLGDFSLEIKLDSTMLDKDGYLRYARSSSEEQVSAKEKYQESRIRMTGESFIVPRSYIGLIDGKPYWGTGQYRLEMTLSESCSLNENFYLTEGRDGEKKWDKKLWKEEWKIMKKRNSYKKSMQQPWNSAWDKIKTEWSGGKWVTEIMTPSTSLLIKKGTSYVNGGLETLEKKR